MLAYTLLAFNALESVQQNNLALLALVVIALCLMFCWIVQYSKKKQSLFINRYRPLFPQFILIGISVNLLVASLFALVHFLFMVMGEQFPSMLWFGQIHTFEREGLGPFFVLSVALFIWGIRLAKQGRFLLLGHDWALGRQVNLVRLEKAAVLFSILCVTLVIIYFGVFSFLGLIFPHLLRQFRFFRFDPYHEMTWGALTGGVTLCVLDQLCYRFPFSGVELPVGMMTSVIGPFVLLILLVKAKRRKSLVDNAD
jgi:iron complex transport system permease protein